MYEYLCHHGIKGQKWGVRNGPPYPLKGGAYSRSEKAEEYKKDKKQGGYSINNKKHFDTTITKNQTLATLSYDKNRTKDADMFYAAVTRRDKDQYNALFNKRVEDIETGNMIYKSRINNKATADLKIASEDSGAKVFKQLFENNRDFYNYVTDPERMEKLFVEDKYKFRGYREAKRALDRIRDNPDGITEEDLNTVYRLYNYTIPNTDRDTATQRKKFFSNLKDAGYSGVLDTNDAIYGGFKTDNPVIIFDQSNIVLDSIEDMSATNVKISQARLAIDKLLKGI